MSDAGNQETQEILTAVRHDTRRIILKLLREGGTGNEISPKELADHLGMPLANVSYHIRILAGCRMIRLTRTKDVRGSLQHFYEATGRLEHPVARATLGDGEGGHAGDR
jgi:DNA-binding transcriptional ArsR family regulator